MASIIFISILTAIGVGLLSSASNHQRLWISNLNPKKKKIEADFQKMKLLLEPKVKELIPWTSDEANLLSLEQVDFKKKKRGVIVTQGVFTSIYHEPMVAYTYKKYINKKYEDAIIYARTSNRAFEYRIKKDEVSIKINNKSIGTLKANGILYRKNRLMARINRSNSSSPILLHTQKGHMKELGHVTTQRQKDDIHQRALQLVDRHMNDNEEAVFLSLVLFEMVYHAVKK